MAMVFRARDETLGRTVALKILAPALTTDVGFRERFARESRAASMVDHPNIIPVYAAGEDGGVLYLAMRYVPGGDLHSVVEKEGPLPPGRAVSLLAPVASALDAAHRAGIVHRDVKPANVLVDVIPGRPDHPYLSDFGLAKKDTAAGLTMTGNFVGTAGFVAPEQISGQPARSESDQYALACVAFTMLTGSAPFEHSSPEAVLWAQMSQPPPRVVPRRPDLSHAVDDVIARGLARNPLDRYSSCVAFADALRQALSMAPEAPPHAGMGTARGGHVGEVQPVQSRAPSALASAQPSLPSPVASRPAGGGPSAQPSPKPRRSRIAVGAGGVVVVIAAAACVVLLRGALGHPGTAAGFRTPPAAAGLKVSARRAATLNDTGGDDVVTAVFGPDGTFDTIDQIGRAYTFAIASEREVSTFDLAGGDLSRAQLALDGQAIVSPGSGCDGGKLKPCVYHEYYFQTHGWTNIATGGGTALGVGYVTLADAQGDVAQVWNLLTRQHVADLADPDRRPVAGIAVSPDDSSVAVSAEGAGGTHKVYVWGISSPSSAAAKTLKAALTVPGQLGYADPELDGAPVPVDGAPDPGSAPLPVGATFMALDSGGGTLAVSNGQRTEIYNVRSRRLITTVPDSLAALSPDGKLFATTDTAGDGRIELRDTLTGKTVATVATPAAPSTVTFGPGGRSVAVGCGNGATYVWNLAGS
jgi:serine/threonine-protein kinase